MKKLLFITALNTPRPIPPHRIAGFHQRVCVGDGSAADRAAMQDHHVPEKSHVEEAAQSQPRPPEPAPYAPVGCGEILGPPAAAHLHHGYAVAFLGKAMRGDTPAKTGANHNEIEVVAQIGHEQCGQAIGAGPLRRMLRFYFRKGAQAPDSSPGEGDDGYNSAAGLK